MYIYIYIYIWKKQCWKILVIYICVQGKKIYNKLVLVNESNMLEWELEILGLIIDMGTTIFGSKQ